jgi:hypothetical protein
MDPRTAKMLADHAQADASVPPPLRGIVRFKNKARAWVKASRVRAIGVSIAATVALIVGYVTTIAWPAAERDRLANQARAVERLTAEVAARQTALDACLSKAQAESEERWASACTERRERAGCVLPARVVEEQQQRESQARTACLMVGF